MNKVERFAEGDRIEVIDTQHRDYKKKGTIVEITSRQLQMLNKPEESGIIHVVRVKLETSDKLIDFTSHPKKLETQIRRIPK